MIEVKKDPFYTFVKTLCDYVGAVLILTVMSPAMLVFAVKIHRDSPGPVIYRQKRLGKNGREFTLYKFRTMRIDAEEEGPKWAEVDDPRITDVGKMLRKTRMDELPQLINILKHQMSLVGPRPERKVFRDEFIKELPDFDDRLAVLPGISGYAQVRGGYDLTPEEKLRLDQEYIRIRGIKLDVRISVDTVKIILSHDGAR